MIKTKIIRRLSHIYHKARLECQEYGRRYKAGRHPRLAAIPKFHSRPSSLQTGGYLLAPGAVVDEASRFISVEYERTCEEPRALEVCVDQPAEAENDAAYKATAWIPKQSKEYMVVSSMGRAMSMRLVDRSKLETEEQVKRYYELVRGYSTSADVREWKISRYKEGDGAAIRVGVRDMEQPVTPVVAGISSFCKT